MSARETAPCLGIVEAHWRRIENQTEAVTNDDDEDIIEFSDPHWEMSVSVTIRNRAHFDAWDSFLARRRLHDLTFLMHRTFRPRPRDPLITSDAGLVMSFIDEGASTITVLGYGPNRHAHEGDMIGYRTVGDNYWVGQVMADAVANNDGHITLRVWPRPRALHPTIRSATRFRAQGEFRLTEAPRIREGFKNWSVRFEARQVIG